METVINIQHISLRTRLMFLWQKMNIPRQFEIIRLCDYSFKCYSLQIYFLPKFCLRLKRWYPLFMKTNYGDNALATKLVCNLQIRYFFSKTLRYQINNAINQFLFLKGILQCNFQLHTMADDWKKWKGGDFHW